jgi:hypothetical protein
VSVTVQRLGYVNWFKAVNVFSRIQSPVDPDAALEKMTRAFVKVHEALSAVARTDLKVYPMYQKLN